MATLIFLLAFSNCIFAATDPTELTRFQTLIGMIAKLPEKTSLSAVADTELDNLLGGFLSCKSDAHQLQSIRQLMAMFRKADTLGNQRIEYIDASLAQYAELTTFYRKQLRAEATRPPRTAGDAPSKAVIDTLLSYDCQNTISNAAAKGVTRHQMCKYAGALADEVGVTGVVLTSCL
jgi:hypothetical protein